MRIQTANHLCIGALFVVAVGLWLPRFQGPIDLRWDAGVYYISGTAIAAGQGYRILSEPGEIRAIQYPPLLPTTVAGIQFLMGTNDAATVGRVLRFLYFGLSLALTIATYAFGRLFLAPSWAFFAALIPTLHVHSVFLSTALFAELPYSLATVLFFLATIPAHTKPTHIPESRVRKGLATFLAAAAYLLRTAGIALLAAWVAASILHKRWRCTAIAVLVSVLCVGSWQSYIISVKEEPIYKQTSYLYQRADYQYYNVGYVENWAFIDPFKPERGKLTVKDFVARIIANLRALPGRIGETITAERWWFGRTRDQPSKLRGFLFYFLGALPLFWFLGALPVVGLAVLSARRRWMVPAYVGTSLVLICVTPWPTQLVRYLLPLAPMLGVSTAVALTALTGALGRMLPNAKSIVLWAPAIGVAGLILGIQGFGLEALFRTEYGVATYQERDGRSISYRLFFYDQNWKAHDAAIDWLAAHASPEDVVVTRTPHWLFIRTGLKAVMPPFEPDPVLAQTLVESVRAKYVLIDNMAYDENPGRRYALPMLEHFPARWRRVYANNAGSALYERVDSSGPKLDPRPSN